MAHPDTAAPKTSIAIRGGTVIDGTGGPPVRADVRIVGDRIVEVGACPDAADVTIDASGALVTPGFLDLHTHYDGQATWDGELLPSAGFGVTTAVIGNCGVGFAPARAADRARLVTLMEGVEDIPGSALSLGLPWTWETFPEYLAHLRSIPRTMDLAAQICHDPLRVYVMGERAFAGSPATADDVARMRAIVADALSAGAIGFSTGRSDVHKSGDGKDTPAAEASAAELVGIAEAFAGSSRGVLQAVSDFDVERASDRFDAEFDVLEAMARAAGRPLTISLSQRDHAPDQWRAILRRVEAARAKGLAIGVQVAARGIGVLLGYELSFHPFMGFPSYKAIAHLPLAERARRLRDPALRAAILAEKSEPLAGDGSPVPPLADKLLQAIDRISARLFRLGDPPDYEPPIERSLLADAKRRGVRPLEAIYDAMLEDDGRALLYFPIYNYGSGNLDLVREMLLHPAALAGLSDGGAHVGTVCDASFPAYLLAHWARDRPNGLSLPRAVAMLTDDIARHLGLADRGVVAPGRRADLNVIDLPRLGWSRPRVVYDLPGGARRLLQDGRGFRATLLAGTPVVLDDVLTGARPGGLATGRGTAP